MGRGGIFYERTIKTNIRLVERFQRNIETYHSPAYNETQLRIEFIDPFFEALGWVANRTPASHKDSAATKLNETEKLP